MRTPERVAELRAIVKDSAPECIALPQQDDWFDVRHFAFAVMEQSCDSLLLIVEESNSSENVEVSLRRTVDLRDLFGTGHEVIAHLAFDKFKTAFEMYLACNIE